MVHYLGHVEGFAWGGWDGEFVFFLANSLSRTIRRRAGRIGIRFWGEVYDVFHGVGVEVVGAGFEGA